MRRSSNNRRAASGSEYGLGVGLVAAAALVALLSSGQRIETLLNASADAISQVVEGTTNGIDDGMDDGMDDPAGSDASAGPPQTQLEKLTASDGKEDDYFGGSVAISGDIAVVGAASHDASYSKSGAVYLFDTATGQETGKLTPNDAAASDYFGVAVGISGNTVIVGAYYDDDKGSESGSAYLFNADTGAQIAKLTAPDGAPDDEFGISVAISGDRAIVGAHNHNNEMGAAYVFDATTGDFLDKFGIGDDTGANFGRSVALSGDLALIGAPDDQNVQGDYVGSAYLYDITTGQRLSELRATDGADFDKFGHSVGLSGTTAVVGAYEDADAGTSSGSAYLFDLASPTNLAYETAKLTRTDAATGDWFGISVAIGSTTAIIGAPRDDDGGNASGSAYVFDTTNGAALGKLRADDATFHDYLGGSVAISDGIAILGAASDSDTGNGDYSGSAYLFD